MCCCCSRSSVCLNNVGHEPDTANKIYSWSDVSVGPAVGYSIVEAINETHLYYKWVNSVSSEVEDRMMLTQDIAFVSQDVADDDSLPGNATDDDSLSHTSTDDVGRTNKELETIIKNAIIFLAILGSLGAVLHIVISWTHFRKRRYIHNSDKAPTDIAKRIMDVEEVPDDFAYESTGLLLHERRNTRRRCM
jgi:hypothetical protein